MARTIETVFPTDGDLDGLLAEGRTLRVKLGLDLTSPQVHIGNEIGLRLLARFQQLGHLPILILGDFTAQVGDPSGRDKSRPTLTAEQVAENERTWLDQIGTVLDIARAEVRHNSEWLGKLDANEIVTLAGQLTVAQMMERDSFSQRYSAGSPIHLHEFLYCLFQGYDSIAVESDIELGGSDQTFNLNIGRTLQKNAGLRPQLCVTTPLIEGVDGSKKMAKSLGNSIGMTSPAKEMFGLATRVPDELVDKYLRLATDLPDARIAELLSGDIWEAKKAMAESLTARHHGDSVAVREREEFERVFKHKELPDVIPECTVEAGEVLLSALVRQTFRLSGGEAKRLIQQGGVTVDGAKQTDPQGRVRIEGGEILRAGKRRFARLVVK
ncbi:MAG: tyrosine--tRNA ligase [Planctomycetota bacterium]